jgi:hypothetical protein
MGVKINSGAPVAPQVAYDRVHMTGMYVKQPVFFDDNVPALYSIEVHYRLYGVVDGTRYYKDEPISIVEITDFLTLAQTKAGEGDMTMANALTSIEEAVAAILKDQKGMDTSTT